MSFLRHIFDVEIESLLAQICANEKVVSFFTLPVYQMIASSASLFCVHTFQIFKKISIMIYQKLRMSLFPIKLVHDKAVRLVQANTPVIKP